MGGGGGGALPNPSIRAYVMDVLPALHAYEMSIVNMHQFGIPISLVYQVRVTPTSHSHPPPARGKYNVSIARIGRDFMNSADYRAQRFDTMLRINYIIWITNLAKIPKRSGVGTARNLAKRCVSARKPADSLPCALLWVGGRGLFAKLDIRIKLVIWITHLVVLGGPGDTLRQPYRTYAWWTLPPTRPCGSNSTTMQTWSSYMDKYDIGRIVSTRGRADLKFARRKSKSCGHAGCPNLRKRITRSGNYAKKYNFAP